jgi:hypothetical protein
VSESTPGNFIYVGFMFAPWFFCWYDWLYVFVLTSHTCIHQETQRNCSSVKIISHSHQTSEFVCEIAYRRICTIHRRRKKIRHKLVCYSWWQFVSLVLSVLCPYRTLSITCIYFVGDNLRVCICMYLWFSQDESWGSRMAFYKLGVQYQGKVERNCQKTSK